MAKSSAWMAGNFCRAPGNSAIWDAFSKKKIGWRSNPGSQARPQRIKAELRARISSLFLGVLCGSEVRERKSLLGPTRHHDRFQEHIHQAEHNRSNERGQE